MNSKEMVKIAYEALSDKKGQDIKIIDIQSVSVLADYFIIADGSNPNQVQAMADNVEEMLGKAGCECKQIEGYQSANWILMDYKEESSETLQQQFRKLRTIRCYSFSTIMLPNAR